MEKIIAIIPARKQSTRLENKMLQKIGTHTIIELTYNAVVATQLFSEVIVATDDEEIKKTIEKIEGKAVLTSIAHQSGTDRIAEVAKNIDHDIVVNVQGDEPFISKENLEKVIALFANKEVEVGTLMQRITDTNKINNPNCVKVVTDKNNKAIYFSRAAIPFYRDTTLQTYYQHIGVYAFRKQSLLKFVSMPVSPLEQVEKLENLRMIENGMQVYLAEVNHVGISIDTAEDLEAARTLLL